MHDLRMYYVNGQRRRSRTFDTYLVASFDHRFMPSCSALVLNPFLFMSAVLLDEATSALDAESEHLVQVSPFILSLE
jgi:hypothetical protein